MFELIPPHDTINDVFVALISFIIIIIHIPTSATIDHRRPFVRPIQFLKNILCISSLQNNLPPEVISNSKEFELALATLIIMLAPVTPHFCSELWSGFLSAPNRLNENSHLIKWDKAVLEQTWPKVDDNFELSYMCKVNYKNCYLGRYLLIYKNIQFRNLASF